jgi:ADP-ribosylglycohydrolase
VIGAIAGDMIGSIYEAFPIKTVAFPLFERRSCFTDDSVLTVAVADVILHGGGYVERFREYYRRHPNRGYGGGFHVWAQSAEPKPYGSYGNGSAMRVSPIGFAFDELETVLAEAKRSAEVTHSHPEGIKGCASSRGGNLPCSPRDHQRGNPVIYRAHIRIRSGSKSRDHSPGLLVRCNMPGHRPGCPSGVSGIQQFRRNCPQRGVTGW